MTPRPVTDSDYINGLHPMDVVNFPVWVSEVGIPKVCEQIGEILTNHTKYTAIEFSLALKEQGKLLEDINRDLVAANKVALWFMEEAPKHIIMMAEEGDDIVITYDTSSNWLEILEDNSPAVDTADKNTKE